MGETRKGRGTPGRRRRSPVFVDRPEVREALGLSNNTTLATYIERGWCPPPDRWLTPKRPVWYRKAFERWLYGRQPDGPAIQSSADTSSNAK